MPTVQHTTPPTIASTMTSHDVDAVGVYEHNKS
jgi:hypothetical protein